MFSTYIYEFLFQQFQVSNHDILDLLLRTLFLRNNAKFNIVRIYSTHFLFELNRFLFFYVVKDKIYGLYLVF